MARSLLVATVVGAVLCLPLAAAYRGASQVVGQRTADDVRTWSAVPSDFLRANPDNRLYGNSRNPGAGERRLFPGWTAPALTLAAFVPPIAPASAAVAA